MSVKKDRFNKRKYRNAKHSWYNAPAQFRKDLNRWRRAQVSQALREGRYENLPCHRHDAAWLYW